MKIVRWLPWRRLVTRIARAYGFLDPIQLLARLRQFSRPSEVSEPIELLRAGVLFHARGLVNTKAIQNNLDWVWPYWVERQFNPADPSFIPRAFSFSHINLTHRNWTAVGLPDLPYYPIVDPRGLVTPLYDGWSLDFWLFAPNRILLPSKLESAEQQLETGDGCRVMTQIEEGGWSLRMDVALEIEGQSPVCTIAVSARASDRCELVVALRPYNPEGISFIESITLDESSQGWIVNGQARVRFDRRPVRNLFSCYKEGDVVHQLAQASSATRVECPVSMASAAAVFSLAELNGAPLRLRVPIIDELTRAPKTLSTLLPKWADEITNYARVQLPDATSQRLFEQAVSTLVLFSPGEVFPGPYTYKRFWFRDAAFILNALLAMGAVERVRRALEQFPSRQTHAGYFLSQEGEWDSNGEALWIMHRYSSWTGQALDARMFEAVERGARWILEKRLPKNLPEVHAGLLPAGFSAEHLGPNDHYYWDNFWGVAGLRAAAAMLKNSKPQISRRLSDAADEYFETVVASFKHIPDRQARGAISASPHRRLDSGAIGSLVADYPLQLFPAGEVRLMKTVEFLMNHSFFAGGFFQNMIHSGINAYLTLHIAQVLLRAGDARALALMDAVAALASPTGQWPEAIHPQTRGGCMGDGQHVWAAAEWVMMMRNLFVREEGNRLIIGSGIFPRWLEAGQMIALENCWTAFGRVSVRIFPEPKDLFLVEVEGDWRGAAPELEYRLPGRLIAARQPNMALLEVAR
ncbi:MAG: hypothetical protein AB1813_13430 [Verrucomicrobiota bacterium]